MCYRFSRQMYNWNLPHVPSCLSVWGIALWQHTIFTVVTDRILWSIKCCRSAVFLEIHLCENKRKRSSVGIHPLSPVFLCEHQEEEWSKEADTYTASTQYWLMDVTFHNLETYQNWQCLLENRFSWHVWVKTYLRWTQKLSNPKTHLQKLWNL